MKRIMSIILVAVALVVLAPFCVSAAIPVNDGQGVGLVLENLINGSSGGSVEITTETSDEFETVYQKALTGVTSETLSYFRFDLGGLKPIAGDYFYISFYYRFIVDEEHSLPNRFFCRDVMNANSGTFGNLDLTTKWKKVSYVLRCENDIKTSYADMFIACTSKITGTYKLQVAEPACAYFGAITQESDSPTTQINEALVFTFERTMPETGYDDFELEDGQVAFIYNKELNSVSASLRNVTVTKSDDNTPVDYSVHVEGNRLLVRFPSGLEPSTQYTVTASPNVRNSYGESIGKGSTMTFKTTANGLMVKAPVFEPEVLPMYGDVKATVGVMSPAEDAQEATLYLAAYGTNNELLALEKQTALIGAEPSDSLSATINLNSYSGVSIKAFVCGADGNLLRNGYSFLAEKAEEEMVFSGGGNIILSIDEASFTDNRLMLRGSVKPASQRTVLIRVTDKNSNCSMLVPIQTAADGSFKYEYELGKSGSEGIYDIEVQSRTAIVPVKTELFYISDDTWTVILSGVNDNTKSEIDMERTVSGYGKEYSDFNFGQEYFNENLYRTLYEQRPFATENELLAMMAGAHDILATLNDTGWENLSDVLADHSYVILYGNADYSYYSFLAANDQKRINQNIKNGKNFDSFAEFRDRFSAAVKQYKDSIVVKPVGGGGGGGGGGPKTSAGTPSFVFSAPPVTSKASESVVQTQPAQSSFHDLKDVSWAVEGVEYLYSKNIVSGDGLGAFRPSENVTREEFVKMLVLAFGMKGYSEISTFSDVQPGAWYFEYIEAAHEKGIVKGDSDASFGIGRSITREDMAVMAFRAAQSMGVVFDSADSTALFKDDDMLNDYAREAVYCMSNAEIINGIGNSMFAPTENCTRAQAAAMLYRLMKKTDDSKNAEAIVPTVPLIEIHEPDIKYDLDEDTVTDDDYLHTDEFTEEETEAAIREYDESAGTN